MKAFRVNQKGFTLIEVLVAITLLSFLMISIFTITDSSIETKDRVVAEDREFLQILTALDLIDRDFSQIHSPLYFQFTKITPNELGPEANEIFDSENPPPRYLASEKYPQQSHTDLPIPTLVNDDPRSFIFMTTSNRRKALNSMQSRYSWVYYYTVSYEPDDPDEEVTPERSASLQLMRAHLAQNPYEKEFDWDSTRAYPILKGIKEFKFEFWDRENKRYVESIRALNKDGLTPRKIKVSFIWIASDGIEYPIERTFRPLYPYFDRDEEQALYIKIMRESAQAKRQARQGRGADDRGRDFDGDQGDFQ
jgi:prepilin-type N-terminal cleavage/methylation domain-containing protein